MDRSSEKVAKTFRGRQMPLSHAGDAYKLVAIVRHLKCQKWHPRRSFVAFVRRTWGTRNIWLKLPGKTINFPFLQPKGQRRWRRTRTWNYSDSLWVGPESDDHWTHGWARNPGPIPLPKKQRYGQGTTCWLIKMERDQERQGQTDAGRSPLWPAWLGVFKRKR